MDSGVTYLAEELALARPVTIKEYFPSDIALRAGGVDVVPRSQDAAGDYTWGLERFIEEAQTLAKFNHTNIVQLHRYFRDNKTGYMVLHFEEGQSLKGRPKALGRAPRQKELDVQPGAAARRAGDDPQGRFPAPRHRPRQRHHPQVGRPRADRLRVGAR